MDLLSRSLLTVVTLGPRREVLVGGHSAYRAADYDRNRKQSQIEKNLS